MPSYTARLWCGSSSTSDIILRASPLLEVQGCRRPRKSASHRQSVLSALRCLGSRTRHLVSISIDAHAGSDVLLACRSARRANALSDHAVVDPKHVAAWSWCHRLFLESLDLVPTNRSCGTANEDSAAIILEFTRDAPWV